MNLEKFLIPSIKVKDKVHFYENISNLLEGGVSLIPSIQGYRDRIEHLGVKKELDNLLFFLEGGDALSVSMRKIPNFFSDGEITIIESGEQTGKIQSSFVSLASDLRDQDELRGKIRNAMTYPFIIFIFLIIAICIVMIYVLPQIRQIIDQAQGDLPFSTRSLMAVSGFMQEHFMLILLVLIGIGMIWRGYISTEQWNFRFDTWKMKIPVIGMVYRNYLTVKVMSTFSLLLGSGISIVKTLKLTGASTDNLVVQEIFKNITEAVSHGKRIAESMKEADPQEHIFTNNILQMIESAEKTSTINTVANKLSLQYRREVDTSLAIMVKFIEPIALIFAAVFVLWFAIAIFSAIMQVVSTAWW